MRRWVNLFCLCFALTALRAVAASPSKIAMIHVSVIDVRAGTIKPDMTVLIQGDRITEVRPSKNNESLSAKDIQVIDGRDKFLLPGLWDMHVHTDGEDRVLHFLLANGITGVRDMAGGAAKLTGARRRIKAGGGAGPRAAFLGPQPQGPPAPGGEWTPLNYLPPEGPSAISTLVG